MIKLNSIRLLTKQKIDFQVHQFPDTIHDATEVAAYLEKPPQQVYKTLVVLRDRPKTKTMLVMIQASAQLDLKKLAKAIQEKKVRMASHAQAESLTGLKVGGISALALLNKGFDTYIDEAAQALDRILVSAGQRGINLELPQKSLVKITKARWVNAIRDS